MAANLEGMTIHERVLELQEQIGRIAGDRLVTLVAVTKYTTVECMAEAYQAGIRHFGENRVQDALAKQAHFPPAAYPNLAWHLIGTLQTNKAAQTVGRFDWIHSVDSTRLAEVLSAANVKAGRRQKALLQVNLGVDASRRGFAPDALVAEAAILFALPGLDVQGLMTMAPPEASLTGDAVQLERIFDGLRRLSARLSAMTGKPLPELSMGMSRDFSVALANGATMVRVGNYLFQTG